MRTLLDAVVLAGSYSLWVLGLIAQFLLALWFGLVLPASLMQAFFGLQPAGGGTKASSIAALGGLVALFALFRPVLGALHRTQVCVLPWTLREVASFAALGWVCLFTMVLEHLVSLSLQRIILIFLVTVMAGGLLVIALLGQWRYFVESVRDNVRQFTDWLGAKPARRAPIEVILVSAAPHPAPQVPEVGPSRVTRLARKLLFTQMVWLIPLLGVLVAMIHVGLGLTVAMGGFMLCAVAVAIAELSDYLNARRHGPSGSSPIAEAEWFAGLIAVIANEDGSRPSWLRRLYVGFLKDLRYDPARLARLERLLVSLEEAGETALAAALATVVLTARHEVDKNRRGHQSSEEGL